MTEFELLLEKATDFHGETCPGIVMGTRMTIAGLRELGMDPHTKTHDLIVYAEVDRCAVDAIQAITGVTLGRRSLKLMNYGIFAATFIDTGSGKAVRVSFLPPWPDQIQGMMEFGKTVRNAPEEEIFRIQEVSVTIPPEEKPGFPTRKNRCVRCGEQIMDGKEEILDQAPVCKKCAHGPYYGTV
ncbi:MAG: FmdE family protein [Methanospirillum sp.]|uniref:FmdE family protein n=1 Tax=Methanospirillum sp. TaxID=45200 RepID=UPI00236B3025|nr:FmdE family protein [Methanospirillum sp.]MDD1729017.1 FmdE family protein [Methanospirillum sp.]